MSDSDLKMAIEVSRLAAVLPEPILLSLAETIGGCDPSDWTSTRLRAVQSIPHAHYRNVVSQFLDHWTTHAASVTPRAVSLAILAAAQQEQTHRDRQAIELVWTGPATNVVPLRQTEQAILQVLNSAQSRILLVSYAVYSIPNIQDAVVRAAKRGVTITVVVETPNKLDVQNEYSTLQALGDEVVSCSRVYYWPKANRKADESGRLSMLHVKCVVGDGNQLFLSSANLTTYAFNLNMELGVLIAGGKAPKQIEALFGQLIQEGLLVKY
ncbi:MAG: DISARM system phospholipase D-like protein DrmC [Isosphaeraceae bacterium]